MANRGNVPEKKPEPVRSGPWKVNPESLTAWDVALDLLKPGTVSRMTRYNLAVSRKAAAGEILIQKELADDLKCAPRTLSAYLTQDSDRKKSLSPEQRRSLAAFVCDNRDTEPWLSEGRWFDDRQVCIAPDWLQKADIISQLGQVGHLLALAHLRLLQQNAGGDIGIAKHLTADRWSVFRHKRGTASTNGLVPLDQLMRWMPEVEDLQVGLRMRLESFYSEMKKAKLDQRHLWMLAPKQVQAAADKVLKEPESLFGSGVISRRT